MGWIKNALQQWLNIVPGIKVPINIVDVFSYSIDVFRNRMWYRGDPVELHQFYTQLDDNMNNTTFWAARPTTNIKLRKIHSGIPALVVDKLVDIVVDNIIGIDFKRKADTERWNEVAEGVQFQDVLRKAVRSMLVDGDGAFKISSDDTISGYPLLDFKSGDEVEYVYKSGLLTAIKFNTRYKKGSKPYLFVETYSDTGIDYKLYDEKEEEVPLSTIEEVADYAPFTSTIMLAEQLLLSYSSKHDGRGKSIFEGKSGSFDALDEVVSQWVEALRDGRTRTYFPKNLCPTDKDGKPLEPNPFDNRWHLMGADLVEGAKNHVEVVQGDIQSDPMIQAYTTYLDLSLQGILSPSTLGIDVKKLDNAEAQREKEKATLYTRNKIINLLTKAIPSLVNKIMMAYDYMSGVEKPDEYDVSIKFGEYANPSFEAQVETIGKAKTSGIMSIERVVEELYGDTWTDEEKAAEVKRIKDEQGIIVLEDPSETNKPPTPAPPMDVPTETPEEKPVDEDITK